jgi:hypothetical protein
LIQAGPGDHRVGVAGEENDRTHDVLQLAKATQLDLALEIAPSITSHPVCASVKATRVLVFGLRALQSIKTGLWWLCLRSVTNPSARATASPGGTIERMMAAVVIVSGEASSIPAARALSIEAALRPESDVSTRAPCSTRRADIALPMAPGEWIAITMFMQETIIEHFRVIK